MIPNKFLRTHGQVIDRFKNVLSNVPIIGGGLYAQRKELERLKHIDSLACQALDIIIKDDKLTVADVKVFVEIIQRKVSLKLRENIKDVEQGSEQWERAVAKYKTLKIKDVYVKEEKNTEDGKKTADSKRN